MYDSTLLKFGVTIMIEASPSVPPINAPISRSQHLAVVRRRWAAGDHDRPLMTVMSPR